MKEAPGHEFLQIHATCIEFAGAGILIRGGEGSGKSDLALRLIDAGARLVADDRVDLSVRLHSGDEELHAAPPPEIAGLLEVRGLGIVRLPHVVHSRVRLVVDLVDRDGIERLPEAVTNDYLGQAVPLMAIAPFEASAVARLRLAARAQTHDILVDEVTPLTVVAEK